MAKLPPKNKKDLERLKKLFQEGLEEGVSNPSKYEDLRREKEKGFKSTINPKDKAKGKKDKDKKDKAKKKADAQLVLKVASRAKHALSVGETYESETWRVHRFATSISATHLVNAGKRGKKCQTIVLYSMAARNIPVESISMEFEMLAQRNVNFDRMMQAAEEASATTGMDIEVRTERGVDVMPAGFKVLRVRGKNVSVEAEYNSFTVKALDDPNESTCIPAISGGKKSIPAFYRWVKDNEKKIEGMKFHEVTRAMSEMGIEYHSYCAMD